MTKGNALVSLDMVEADRTLRDAKAALEDALIAGARAQAEYSRALERLNSASIAAATALLKAATDNYASVAGLSQVGTTTQPAGATELSAARRQIAQAKAQLNTARQQVFIAEANGDSV